MTSNTRDSPPPRPPATLSPGIRATALNRNFDQALAHTLRSCSYSNFAACFPTPAQHVPEALGGLHHEFVGKLEQVCKAEFSALVEERSVIPSLNELDGLITDARKRMESSNTIDPPNPPHLLPPTSLLGAHLAHFLSSQTVTLESQLDTAQANNRELVADILSQKMTIEGLLLSLENVIADLETAADIFTGDAMAAIKTPAI